MRGTAFRVPPGRVAKKINRSHKIIPMSVSWFWGNIMRIYSTADCCGYIRLSIASAPFFLSPTLSVQGSVECRLLASVFYDFGKSLAALCPHSQEPSSNSANEFFMSAFQQFISSFPNLRLSDDSFASQKIETGCTRFTYLAYARLHARNGFKKFNPSSKSLVKR